MVVGVVLGLIFDLYLDFKIIILNVMKIGSSLICHYYVFDSSVYVLSNFTNAEMQQHISSGSVCSRASCGWGGWCWAWWLGG